MTNEELKMVAEHMGHSVNVHTDIYRVQQNLIERSKMAMVLSAAEAGTLHNFTERQQLENLNISELAAYIEGK